jgi:hypothetical protein
MSEEDQVYGLLDIESENNGVTTGRTSYQTSSSIQSPVFDSNDSTTHTKEDIPKQQGVDWQYIKNEII